MVLAAKGHRDDNIFLLNLKGKKRLDSDEIAYMVRSNTLMETPIYAVIQK